MPKVEQKNLKDMIPGIFYGACITILATICLILLLSALVSSGRVGEDREPMLVMVSAFMGAVFGGMAARKKNGSSALMSTLASAALAVTARMAISIFSEESSFVDGVDMMVVAAMMCGGVIAGLPGKRKKRRRR